MTNWNSPATTWHDLTERYARYLETPRWRGRTANPDGSLAATALTPKQSASLQRALVALVDPLLNNGDLPAIPSLESIQIVLKHVGYAGKRFDKCPKTVWHLWRAMVFNRDGYTCVHCGRSTVAVQEAQHRGLRFELDHSTPRARLGEACDDFDAANICTACRSCNVLKGQMDADQFSAELISLAEAVVRKNCSR